MAPTTAFECPKTGCYRTFNLQKTLNRHVRAVHSPPSWKCSHLGCACCFARKDTRDRHELEQHGQRIRSFHCTVCAKFVRLRSADDHLKSVAHRAAERRADEMSIESIQTQWNPQLKQWPSVESSADPLLLAAWVYFKLDAIAGDYNRWIHKHDQHPVEVLELKGLAMRVLGRSMSSLHGPVPKEIFRTTLILAVVEVMTNGWKHAKPLRQLLERFAPHHLSPDHRMLLPQESGQWLSQIIKPWERQSSCDGVQYAIGVSLTAAKGMRLMLARYYRPANELSWLLFRDWWTIDRVNGTDTVRGDLSRDRYYAY